MEKMAGESRFNGKRATPSSSRLRHSFGIEFDRSGRFFSVRDYEAKIEVG